jgi:predicted ribosomally synthesized peptide with nif11-like leader
MSKDVALAFIQKISEDTTLQEEILQLDEDNFEGLLALATQEGFAFSPDEWSAAVTSTLSSDEELSLEELDNVAGGDGLGNFIRKFPVALGSRRGGRFSRHNIISPL